MPIAVNYQRWRFLYDNDDDDHYYKNDENDGDAGSKDNYNYY